MEVDVAYPGLDMARLRFHSHKTAMHETHHVTDGVHRRQLFLNHTFIIVEHFHGMREVEIIVDGILISVEFLCKILVDRLSFGDIFDEMGYFLMTLILPGVSRAPMLVERLLYLLHLFDGSFFGIALQAGVDSSVDL